MQDIWSVRFTCLLVCRSAIFIDSKRGGTGAAHGRKGFRMKRAELDRRIANGETLDDIVPALMDDGADITSYDVLIELDGETLADINGRSKYYEGFSRCVDRKPEEGAWIEPTEFGMMFLSILDLGMSEEEAEKSESRLPKHGNGYPEAVTDKSTV